MLHAPERRRPLLLTGCSFDLVLSAIGSFNGATARGDLQPGPHSLAIAFPQAPEPRGAARLRLTYLGEP